MDDSYENRAIRLLLQPSIHLFNILNHYNNENKNKILYCLANEQVTELIHFLNELLENNNEDLEGLMSAGHEQAPDHQQQQLELLNLQLQLRLFISELRESYANLVDLLYHKDDSNAMNVMRIVNNVLISQDVPNAKGIAKEVYNQLFIENSKKDTVYARDSDDYLRDLQILKQYNKKAKK